MFYVTKINKMIVSHNLSLVLVTKNGHTNIHRILRSETNLIQSRNISHSMCVHYALILVTRELFHDPTLRQKVHMHKTNYASTLFLV